MTGSRAAWHAGAHLCVSLRGVPVAELATGEARTGVPMRVESVTPWPSSGKPISAAAVTRLWEKGLLDLDEPVATCIPEFAANGKGGVTARHILTHTAGFPKMVPVEAPAARRVD